MSDTVRRFTLRFSVDGAQQGRQQLQQVGDAGDRAMQRIVGGAQMASRALSLLTPILGALSAGALLNFVRTSVDAVGGLGELAEEAGVTTDALQALQFAATQSGLRNEELTRGLQALTRRLADAAQGNQQAADAFSRYGIAITDAEGRMRPTEQVLVAIADRLRETENPLQQAALATGVFGDRLGQRLIPFLRQGGEGLQELTARAVQFGAIADADLIARADRASDRLAALSDAVTRLARNLAAELAPAITTAALGLERLLFGRSGAERATDRRSALDAREAELQRQLAAATSGAAPAARRGSIRPGLVATAQQQAGVTGDIRIPEIRAAIDQVRAERAALDAELLDTQERARAILAGDTGAARPMAAVNFGGDPFGPNLPARVRGGGGAARQDNAAERDRMQILREIESLTLRTETAQERYNRRIEELEDLNRRAQAAGFPIPEDTLIRARTEALEDLNRELARMDVEGQRAREALMDVGGAFANAFEDAIIKGGRLSDILRNLQADLLRIGTNLLVRRPFEQFLGNLVGPGQGGGAGGGLGGIFGGIGNIFTSIFGSIFHEGGMVGGAAPQRAVPAIAFAGAPRFHNGGFPGLRYDEVPAILQRGERVLSREEVRRGGGNGQVNVTIVAPSPDTFSASRSLIEGRMARAVRMGARNT